MARQDTGVVVVLMGIPPRGRGGSYERAKRVYNQVVKKDISLVQRTKIRDNIVFIDMDDCDDHGAADRLRKVKSKLLEKEREMRKAEGKR